MTFILGLLTGLHCISMCGAFIIAAGSNSPNRKPFLNQTLFLLGKLFSYTLLGGLLGWIGSKVLINSNVKIIFGILVSFFLIAWGLHLLGFLNFLIQFSNRFFRSLSLWIDRKIISKRRNLPPFGMGFLNGFMISCGPLQAIYVLAANSGHFLEGAELLFLFGLGTSIPLFVFSLFSQYILDQFSPYFNIISGVFLILMGLITYNRNLTLMGIGFDLERTLFHPPTVQSQISTLPAAKNLNLPPENIQTITMQVDESGYHPDSFQLIEGIETKWIIHVKKLTPCNKTVTIPGLNTTFDLHEGTQEFKFTPPPMPPNQLNKNPLRLQWSCGMGMIKGQFEIVK